MIKYAKLLHPFLLALYPVFFLFSQNKEELLPTVIIKPALFVLSLTLVVFFLLTVVIRNTEKRAILVSFSLLLFFSYGHFKNLVPPDFNIAIAKLKIGFDETIMTVWIAVFVGGLYFIKNLNKLNRITSLFNIMALSLVFITLTNIISYELKTRRLQPFSGQTGRSIFSSKKKETQQEKYPDIYYLIFDRYGSTSTLKEQLNFDNSKFADFLNQNGFFVASESYANYPKTFQSLASSLNMQHLTYLTSKYGNSSDQAVVNQMLEDYEVWRFLKMKSYLFIHLGSWWEPTRKNSYADININYSLLGLDEFSSKLFETTVFYPLFTKAASIKYKDENSRRIEQKIRIPYKFAKLAEIARIEAPKFVFAHFLIPHGPYVFDADGSMLSEKEASKRTIKENYLNQLIFTNKQIEKLVSQILSSSEQKPIIILQSDEGPCDVIEEFTNNQGWVRCGEDIDWQTLNTKALQTKMRILNAYFLPGVNYKEALYSSITPVNTFRVIFNHYFNASYELLPNTSYIFKDLDHPYRFIDVTDKVKY